MSSKIQAYIHLTRLHKPIGIYLVLWPALWALWLASPQNPAVVHVIIFTLGAIVMRSAGCVINDFADRHWDGEVNRTADRPLVTGAIQPKEAMLFFGLLCLMGLGLVLLLNTFTVFLSLGALCLAALYPFMKRHTHWPQVFLGAAFAWAIPMGFAAEQNALPIELWWVFVTTLLWAVVYDTAYAMVDREDDLKVGIKSTAILFGSRVNVMIGLFQVLMFIGLLGMGQGFQLGVYYHVMLVGVAGLFVYHQILLAKNQVSLAFKVFLQNHWVGVLVLVGIVLDKNLSL